MSWDWQEISRLLTTDEFKIGLLLLVVGSFALFPKGMLMISGILRKRAYSSYAASISFGRQEIARALKGYVIQQGMKSDPSTKVELNDAFSVPRIDIFKMMDDFILGSSMGRHLFVFADCGMGKTTFLINYFHRRRRRLFRRHTPIILISLARDSYLNEIEAVPIGERGHTALLMDAFDEDPLVFEGVQKRLDLIVKMTLSFKCVVISCRSQFFASDSDIPVLTGELRAGPTPSGKSKEYEFQRIYLAPFDDKRVARYLRLAFPGPLSFFKRREARKLVERFPSLVMRPMLLAHISDVLEGEGSSSLMSQAEIFQAIVSGWAKREAHWVPTKDLLQFSKRFALNIFENRHERGGEHCSKDDLRSMALDWGIDVRPELLTGRSLLNRTEDGRCKFAHRSIMEYFIAEGILDGSSSGSLEMTSQITTFLFDRLNIDASKIHGIINTNSEINLVESEKRLGYSTSFNLLHEDGIEINASFVYKLTVVTEAGDELILGDHLQTMLGVLNDGGPLQDVRISVTSQGELLQGFISVWAKHKAVLSRVKIDADHWSFVVNRRWSTRMFFNIVGTFVAGRTSAADIHYKVGTYCNLSDDCLNVDAAERPKVLAADVGKKGEGIVLNLIPGFLEVGPWSPFGILRGGSNSLLAGKRFAVITERVWDHDDASLPGRIIRQEEALVPAAAKWPERRGGRTQRGP